jgi:Haem-binding domain
MRNRGGPIAGWTACGFILIWTFASLRVHLLSHTPPQRTASTLFPGAELTPSGAGIFGHSCADCHSESTAWPWYSRIAPVSWLLERDVKQGRRRMNVTRWDGLKTSDKRRLLAAIAKVIENREMPPRRYLFLHPEARLTADQSVEIIEWIRAERRRLRELQGVSTRK